MWKYLLPILFLAGCCHHEIVVKECGGTYLPNFDCEKGWGLESEDFDTMEHAPIYYYDGHGLQVVE